MAGGSQHLEPIMENQTHFDLNAAVENWRNELAAESSLTPDTRRELETHLRDAIAELRQRGLNDEESFWLARRRVGQPQRLSEEFAKADPSKVWRERMFWICLALFLLDIFNTFVFSLTRAIMPVTGGSFIDRFRLPEVLSLLSFLIPLIMVALVVSGKMNPFVDKLKSFVDGRLRMAVTAIVLVAISATFEAISCAIYNARINYPTLAAYRSPIWQVLYPSCLYLLIVALVLVLLSPAQNRNIPMRA